MKTPEELEEIKKKASVIAAEMFAELATGLAERLRPFADLPIEERLGCLLGGFEYASALCSMLADSVHGSPVYNEAHAKRMHLEARQAVVATERRYRDKLRETGLFDAVPEIAEKSEQLIKEENFLEALEEVRRVKGGGLPS